MSKYKVKLRKPAAKYYEKLPPKLKNKVKDVINQLRENPYAIPNVKPLEGSEHDDYRIRIGSLRLLYRVHNDTLIIIVLDLGPRGDIYKWYFAVRTAVTSAFSLIHKSSNILMENNTKYEGCLLIC